MDWKNKCKLLEQENKALKDKFYVDYEEALTVLINIFYINRPGRNPSHSRVIAQQARSTAIACGMGAVAAEDVYYAGLLHEIGEFAYPPELMYTVHEKLTANQKKIVRTFPLISSEAIMSLEPIERSAKLIRHHRERIDGSGYPDGLRGDSIPLGAKILSVACKFHGILEQDIDKKIDRYPEAISFLRQHSGSHFEPDIVEKFIRIVEFEDALASAHLQVNCNVNFLMSGMTLANHFISEEGLLLLPKYHMLTDQNIEALREMNKHTEKELFIPIVKEVHAIPDQLT